MKWAILLCHLCTCLTFIEAKIIETGHFKDLLTYADADTLFVLDIDDTLLVPEQMLGCDEWFQYRMSFHQKKGMDTKNALEKALAEWEAVRHLTKMEIVEPGTEKIIQTLQARSLPIIGLTTQGVALATRTSQQLAEKHINLSMTAPYKDDHYFQLAGQSVLFRNGILFTSGKHKGEALFELCKASGIKPKRIVFINDKASHLAEVEAAAHKRNIEFIGLRYNYCDARKKAFSPEIADIQFSQSSFAHLLSDKEALEKLALYKK